MEDEGTEREEATQKLRQWLEEVSNPSLNPWPDFVIPEEVEEDEDEDDPVIDPIADHGPDDDCSYKGKRDKDGKYHIYGTLTYPDGDIVNTEFNHGEKHGEAVVISPRRGLSRLVGTYVNDHFEGKGKLVSDKVEISDCFFKRNRLHGPLRRFALKKFREFRQQLDFIGQYRRGRPHGLCWQYKEGGGFLVGVVDEKGGFTHPHAIAYIYPDLRTALLGHFEDGVMKSARHVKLIGVKVEPRTRLAHPEFSTPNPDSPAVHYSKATKTHIGDLPLVPDPYEERHVEVRESDLPGSGDGLFARRHLPAGTIAAFYNGVRLPYKLGGTKEEWATSGYKIYVNADYRSGERMDIPAEYIDLKNYCATFGHKLNHSFRPNCQEWFFEHPRFGLVPCERTLRDVEAGEELFLDYEYDPYNCPEWFSDQLIVFKRSMSDEEEAKLSIAYARFVVDPLPATASAAVEAATAEAVSSS